MKNRRNPSCARITYWKKTFPSPFLPYRDSLYVFSVKRGWVYFFSFLALIDGADGTCVRWESLSQDGYSYINLVEHSRSAELICFDENTAEERGFHLVIPGNVLDSSSMYMFKLIASNPSYENSFVTTQIKTMNLPEMGSCEVSYFNSLHIHECLRIAVRQQPMSLFELHSFF